MKMYCKNCRFNFSHFTIGKNGFLCPNCGRKLEEPKEISYKPRKKKAIPIKKEAYQNVPLFYCLSGTVGVESKKPQLDKKLPNKKLFD